ncbi:hypothetical protein ACNOYE_30140 [Nannocystaceae bacterium ST9]
MRRPSLVMFALSLVACRGVTEADGNADELGSETLGEAESSSTDAGESAGESGSSESASTDTSDASGSTDASDSTDADETSTSDSTDAGETTDSSDSSEGTDTTTGEDPLWTSPSLWYSVEDRLHYIEIDPDDGTVVQLVTSTITTPMIDGQNGITMLEDGSLLLSRESDGATEIYWIAEPPIVASEIEVELLGTVPDELRIEALYTDCQGLVYLMDTGSNVSNAEGNRLIRFTGDYLVGDLDYEVITDLGMSMVADIDDMGPGIDAMGEITDGQGFAIDSGTVYDFDYLAGTGTVLGPGGTWGIHALGGPLFQDGVARLYLLDIDAQLFEADPDDLSLSDVLVTGPEPDGDAAAGWSGITGPLTECESTLPDPQ